MEQELNTSNVSIYNIAVDDAYAKLYWVEYQELKRSNFDGSDVETIINLTTNV